MSSFSTRWCSYYRILIRLGGCVLLLLMLGISACNDFLDVGPPRSQLVGVTAYENKSAAESVLVSVYAEMMSSSQGFASGGAWSISTLAGLSADEFMDSIGDATKERLAFQTNSIPADDQVITDAIWEPAYKYIYYTNAVLEGVEKSTGIKPEDKAPLEGEAKFLRAFIYFYLTNLFGDVPLILSTDYEVNNVAGKATSQEVYVQILADLNEAQLLLPTNPEYASGRVRPNTFAAKALLARVYLYLGQWQQAESLASEVIADSVHYRLEGIANVFTVKSQEAIWQLMPTSESGFNTYEAVFFFVGSVSLTKDLRTGFKPMNPLNPFEPFDIRGLLWAVADSTGSAAPFKYRAFKTDKFEEYSMVMRLAEQFLIRAEARARQAGAIKLNLAIKDLDKIRIRAGLPSIRSDHAGEITPDELLADIAHERRLELFSEWGHRWFDLKRTGQADAVLGPLKGGSWQPTDKLYPIPAAEIERNPNLAPQNFGY